MMGLYLGNAVAVALFAALIANVLTGVMIATRRGVYAARKTALPFGPYLAFGGVLAALVRDSIIRADLHLHGLTGAVARIAGSRALLRPPSWHSRRRVPRNP